MHRTPVVGVFSGVSIKGLNPRLWKGYARGYYIFATKSHVCCPVMDARGTPAIRGMKIEWGTWSGTSGATPKYRMNGCAKPCKTWISHTSLGKPRWMRDWLFSKPWSLPGNPAAEPVASTTWSTSSFGCHVCARSQKRWLGRPRTASFSKHLPIAGTSRKGNSISGTLSKVTTQLSTLEFKKFAEQIWTVDFVWSWRTLSGRDTLPS